MRRVLNVLIALVVPPLCISATIYWRVASYPDMPIFSAEWWLRYFSVVTMSGIFGAAAVIWVQRRR